MQLSYQLFRRLKRFKEEKRKIEAIEKELQRFQSLSVTEQTEEIEWIKDAEQIKIGKTRRTGENSPTSEIEKEQRNGWQRTYRAKLRKEKEAQGIGRKEIAPRFPVKVLRMVVPKR